MKRTQMFEDFANEVVENAREQINDFTTKALARIDAAVDGRSKKVGDGCYSLTLRDDRTDKWVTLRFDYFGSYYEVAKDLNEAWREAA